jgi:hypothetical protein
MGYWSAWRTGMVEYTDSDRVREQGQLRASDPNKYDQSVKGIEARAPSPRVQDSKSLGKQASEVAGLHKDAESRLSQIGGSRHLQNWHRAKADRASFQNRRATDAARIQASFKKRGGRGN